MNIGARSLVFTWPKLAQFPVHRIFPSCAVSVSSEKHVQKKVPVQNVCVSHAAEYLSRFPVFTLY